MKSSRLRVMEEDAVGCDVVISEGGVVAAGVESGRLQRTMHLRSPTPSMLAVMVTVPLEIAVTFPSQLTEATLGSLDFQTMLAP